MRNKLINFVNETFDIIREALSAAEQAHKLGLTHIGGGYWVDDSNKIVARTVKQGDTKVLVKYESPEDIPDEVDEDPELDDTRQEIIDKGKVALDLLAKNAAEHAGLDYDSLDSTDAKNISVLVRMAVSGHYVDDGLIDTLADEDEREALADFLDSITNNKTSKVVNAARMLFKQGQYSGKKPKYNPNLKKTAEPEVPSDEKDQSDEKKFDIKTASEIADIDEDHPKWDQFVELMTQMDEAGSTVALNYIGQKFKKADFYGEGVNFEKGTKKDQKSWAVWKALHKYAVSTKGPEFVKGAIAKGKIKDKKKGEVPAATQSLEDVADDVISTFFNDNGLYPSAHYVTKLRNLIDTALSLPEGEVDVGVLSPDIMGVYAGTLDPSEIASLNKLVNKARYDNPHLINHDATKVSDDEAQAYIDAHPEEDSDTTPDGKLLLSKNEAEFKEDLKAAVSAYFDQFGVEGISTDDVKHLTNAMLAYVMSGYYADDEMWNHLANLTAFNSALLMKQGDKLRDKYEIDTESSTETKVQETPPEPKLKDLYDAMKSTFEATYDENTQRKAYDIYHKFMDIMDEKMGGKFNLPSALFGVQVRSAIAQLIISGDESIFDKLVQSGSMSQEEVEVLDQAYDEVMFTDDNSMFDMENDDVALMTQTFSPEALNAVKKLPKNGMDNFFETISAAAIESRTYNEFEKHFHGINFGFDKADAPVIEQGLKDFWKAFATENMEKAEKEPSTGAVSSTVNNSNPSLPPSNSPYSDDDIENTYKSTSNSELYDGYKILVDSLKDKYDYPSQHNVSFELGSTDDNPANYKRALVACSEVLHWAPKTKKQVDLILSNVLGDMKVPPSMLESIKSQLYDKLGITTDGSGVSMEPETQNVNKANPSLPPIHKNFKPYTDLEIHDKYKSLPMNTRFAARDVIQGAYGDPVALSDDIGSKVSGGSLSQNYKRLMTACAEVLSTAPGTKKEVDTVLAEMLGEYSVDPEMLYKMREGLYDKLGISDQPNEVPIESEPTPTPAPVVDDEDDLDFDSSYEKYISGDIEGLEKSLQSGQTQDWDTAWKNVLKNYQDALGTTDTPAIMPSIMEQLKKAYESGDPETFIEAVVNAYEVGEIGTELGKQLQNLVWGDGHEKQPLPSTTQSPDEPQVTDAPQTPTNPLENWEPRDTLEKVGVKSAQTLVNKNGGEMTNEKFKELIPWLVKKGMQTTAMALVKFHGVDPTLVPTALIPDELKPAFSDILKKKKELRTQVEPTVEPTPTPKPVVSGEVNLDPTSDKYNPPTQGDVKGDDEGVESQEEKIKREIEELKTHMEAAKNDPAKYDNAVNTAFNNISSVVSAENAKVLSGNGSTILDKMKEAFLHAVPMGVTKDENSAWKEFKEYLAPRIIEVDKEGNPNPNGVPGMTYDLYRDLAKSLEPFIRSVAKSESPLLPQLKDLQDQLKHLSDITSNSEVMKNMPKFDDGTPEPTTQDTLGERVKRIFKNWSKSTGYALSAVPNNYYGERNIISSAVSNAINEPDPSKVLNHIGGLFTTSLLDKQIVDLMKQVHRERKFPGSTVEFNANPMDDDPVTVVPFKNLMSGLNIPDDKKQSITAVLAYGFQNNIQKHAIRQSLIGLGLHQSQYSKIADWYDSAKNAGQGIDNSGNSTKTSTTSTSPNGIGVKGMKVVQSGAWMAGSFTPNHSTLKNSAVKQYEEQFRPDGSQGNEQELYKSFTKCADAWQSGDQYSHSIPQRRENNHTFTKLAEGPPPATTKIQNGFVERGMNMNESELELFLDAFEIGRLVYLGPSGFSEGTDTPRSRAGKVLLRVYPPKNGELNAVRVHHRPENEMFAGEAELICGARRNLRVREVIKHESTGKWEIIMDQVEEGITESAAPISDSTDKNGFKSQYWKGLSRDTIKVLIKHLNGSVLHA